MRRLFATAWTIWLFDFATKTWALTSLSSGEPRKIIGSFLQLTLVHNPGAAFSFATGFTLVFSLLALAVVVAVVYFAPKITSGGWQLSIGLLLGECLAISLIASSANHHF